MERCGEDRGKGFFLGLMTNMRKCLKSKELKALQDTAQGAGTKDGPNQPGKREDKCMPLYLPLKWNIEGEPEGPLSIIPYASSVFIQSIVCECTTLVRLSHSSKNATMVT